MPFRPDRPRRRLPPFVSALTAGLLLFAFPVRGQDILTFEQYQALDHAEPYVVHLETASGALLYFGARHTFDPADPQLDSLEAAWRAFAPDAAYTEGGDLSIDGLSRDEAVQRFGEAGLTWVLARRDGVPVQTLDPPRAAEVAHLRDVGWTDEQLMLFYTLRNVAQRGAQAESVDFRNVLPRYLASLTARFGLRGPDTFDAFEDAVSRLLPELGDWRSIPGSYFYPGPQDPEFFTNRISTDANRFRDAYHVRVLNETVASGKRVFAVMGSAHVVMQEPALRAAHPHR